MYTIYIRHCSTVETINYWTQSRKWARNPPRRVRGAHESRDTVRVNPTTGDTLFTASSSHYTRTRRGLDHIYPLLQRIEQMYNIIYVVNPKTN